ncbi:Dbl homology (DH) domain [Phaffia rhodozyma]|uniref:Dbl homology (DH) domain n=1 Tax=Phaffia rhodozyma TaxID=264483 RepID=A0A0F7SIP4_PHARH|nr:Dbl homology (DH) domain [Phaffia rhodozyma]
MRAFLARLSNGTVPNNDHHPSIPADSHSPAVIPKLKASERYEQNKENKTQTLPSDPPSLGPIPTVSTSFESEQTFHVSQVTAVVPLRSVSPSYAVSPSPVKPIGRGKAPSTVRIGPPPPVPVSIRCAQAKPSDCPEREKKIVSTALAPPLTSLAPALELPTTFTPLSVSSFSIAPNPTETKTAKSETTYTPVQPTLELALDQETHHRPSSPSSSTPSTSFSQTNKEPAANSPHVSVAPSTSKTKVTNASIASGSDPTPTSDRPNSSFRASPATVPAPATSSSRIRSSSVITPTASAGYLKPRPKSIMSTDSRLHAQSIAGRSSRMSGSFHKIEEHNETTDAERSFVSAPENWSQWADEDLLMNLGPRERTRQEVLWEIVRSEDRYVTDLENLLSTFINALLPSSPVSSSSPPTVPLPLPEEPRSLTSVDRLPIAAKFTTQPVGLPLMSLTGKDQEGSSGISTGRTAGNLSDGASSDPSARPSSIRNKDRSPPTSAPARVRHSLPPVKRSSVDRPVSSLSSSSISQTTGRKLQRVLSHVHLHAQPYPITTTPAPKSVNEFSNTDIFGLPEDLKIILEVLRDGILPGHRALCRALKRRHEEQFPLVRSLADVFTQHSYVLKAYTTYVLHLSDALRTIDQALMSSSSSDGKKKKDKKSAEDEELERLKGIFQELDELAADRGQSGLAISLSKPFQRLVKYPLLLQNLLYNTDPSTKEYEATLSMVDQVELIIRSIEDKKTAVEERVKTRDVFARIEGLEREKMLMIPNPSRLILEEYPCGPDGSKISTTTTTTNATTTAAISRRSTPAQTKGKDKDKTNIRRIGEMLRPSHGSGSGTPNDLWIVRFNDVSLLCQRTGTTSLPLASATSRSPSLPELNAPNRVTATGRRPHQIRPRNIYRFIKLEGWTTSTAIPSKHRPTSTGTLVKGRSLTTRPLTGSALKAHNENNRDLKIEGDRGEESDDSSDTKSQMSFTYRGGDTVEPTPGPGPRPNSSASRRTLASSQSTVASRARSSSAQTRRSSSSAQDKFGSRLRSPELHPGSARPGSRARSNGATSVAGLTTKRAVTPIVG